MLCKYVKTEGASSPWQGFLFKDLSNWTSFCFYLSYGQDDSEAWTGAAVPDVVGCCVTSGIWSFCRKYYFQDRVPTGWEVVGYATKASFFSSESLREVVVTASSSAARETTLLYVPLSLGLLDFYCSSLTISGWTHMISSDLVIIEIKPLASWFWAIGLMRLWGQGLTHPERLLSGRSWNRESTCWRWLSFVLIWESKLEHPPMLGSYP